jgi:hypothetical protein
VEFITLPIFPSLKGGGKRERGGRGWRFPLPMSPSPREGQKGIRKRILPTENRGSQDGKNQDQAAVL